MIDFLENPDWTVRVTSLPQALSEACLTARLSPNVIQYPHLSVHEGQPRAESAFVEWPSYFCDKRAFVLVLAYLVRNHLPLELDVRYTRTGLGTSQFRMHPPLDPHSKEILREINPRDLEALNDLEARANTVFTRLRQMHLEN